MYYFSFLSSVRFFFLLFFLHHTCIPIPISILPFFFLYFFFFFSTWFQNPSLSSLSLDHSLAFSMIRNGERERERERERTKQEILLAWPLIEGKDVRGVVWCGLEFNPNYNRTAPHFYSHMCDTMYKTQFKVGIFLKFWAFPT